MTASAASSSAATGAAIGTADRTHREAAAAAAAPSDRFEASVRQAASSAEAASSLGEHADDMRARLEQLQASLVERQQQCSMAEGLDIRERLATLRLALSRVALGSMERSQLSPAPPPRPLQPSSPSPALSSSVLAVSAARCDMSRGCNAPPSEQRRPSWNSSTVIHRTGHRVSQSVQFMRWPEGAPDLFGKCRDPGLDPPPTPSRLGMFRRARGLQTPQQPSSRQQCIHTHTRISSTDI